MDMTHKVRPCPQDKLRSSSQAKGMPPTEVGGSSHLMTMVQLRKKTVHRLKALKKYGRQTYDEVINQMLDNPDDLTIDDIGWIKRGLEDIRAGRIFTEAQAAQRLGIKS